MKRSTMINIITDRLDQFEINDPVFTNEAIAEVILDRMLDHGMNPPMRHSSISGEELVDLLEWDSEDE